MGIGAGLDTSAIGWGILAITDTVSVIAVFRGVCPFRLSTIVEEKAYSMMVALVLFSLTQVNTTGSLTDGLQELFVVIAGGSLVGLALGYLSTGFYLSGRTSRSVVSY